MSVAIKIENLSKQYRLGLVSTRTLSHDLNRWWQTSILGKDDPYLKIGDTNDRAIKGESEYVWVLKDINLEVQEGEVLGIIGKNGAGKSTLLKILSKVTAPTTGFIKARGRIASLLEVGTGFHPEMTGRENIFMNGSIMGMTKAEIRKKFDEIVNFAGVERYIDTPVKRYSSGMTVRLGFAIAAHLEPEILVVDEVLAVGDAEFQKKAIGKMQDVSQGQGRTVLFVSHNMAAVKSLCAQTLLLKQGKYICKETTDKVIDLYLNELEAPPKYKNKNDINKTYSILLLEIVGENNNSSMVIFHDKKISVNIGFYINRNQKNVELVLVTYDSNFNKIFSTLKKIDHLNLGYNQYTVEIPPKFLAPGYIYFSASIFVANQSIIDAIKNPIRLEIIDNGSEFIVLNSTNYGAVMCDCKWIKTI